MGAARVKSYVVGKKPTRGATVVRHLHGILAPTVQRGSVVLSEDDYHLMQSPRRWQESYFKDRLANTTCLFVGTSLSDPNLLRYLYRSRGSLNHCALFVRQADSWETRPGVKIQVVRARQKAVWRRWRAVNVAPLHADYFMQSAQFLRELEQMRRLQGDYTPYPVRLAAWEQQVRAGILHRQSRRRFRETQDRLQAELSSWLGTIEEVLRGLDLWGRGEKLGLHLWVRIPSTRSLVLWGSSDRAWRDPRTLQPVPIVRPTSWVAVETFCTGTPIVQSTVAEAASRWNFVLGIPLLIESSREERLPVGVLTLASVLPRRRSSLSKLGPDLSDLVYGYLAVNGAELLSEIHTP